MTLEEILRGNNQQSTFNQASLKAQIDAALAAQQPQTFAPQNPFSSAMSGTQAGTLQPYINHQTQLANNALNGGLLNMQPQTMMAGDAGGTPSVQPQGFDLQNALLNKSFGNRSWMTK